MLLLPDPQSTMLDAFKSEATLSVLCDVIDPITRELYDSSPRTIAHRAMEKLHASGVADAAFAIEAAARQLDLDFVPLARERYFLAARDDLARERRFTTLLGILRGRKFKSHVAQLPGYDAARCGEAVNLADALQLQSAAGAIVMDIR